MLKGRLKVLWVFKVAKSVAHLVEGVAKIGACFSDVDVVRAVRLLAYPVNAMRCRATSDEYPNLTRSAPCAISPSYLRIRAQPSDPSAGVPAQMWASQSVPAQMWGE